MPVQSWQSHQNNRLWLGAGVQPEERPAGAVWYA